MERNTVRENAVSPVVGVMLMLVVTIIIAAVVSAFSGGLTSGTDKTPQMSISATFSQSSGLKINHLGGDNVNTLSSKFIVSPTADFGSYNQLKWMINTTVLTINKKGSYKPWNDPTLETSQQARIFQPGDVAILNASNIGQVQPQTYTTNSDSPPTDGHSIYYGFLDSNATGMRFNLQLIDDSGKTIAQTVVSIDP